MDHTLQNAYFAFLTRKGPKVFPNDPEIDHDMEGFLFFIQKSVKWL